MRVWNKTCRIATCAMDAAKPMRRKRSRNGHGSNRTDATRAKQPGMEETRRTHSRGFAAAAHLSEKKFVDLELSEATRKALQDVLRYEKLTTVQDQAMPHVMEGKDVLARARTGTGKTMAFLLPSVEQLHVHKPRKEQVSVLVLSPTRELARQIRDEADGLLKFHPFQVQCVHGGTNANGEIKRLQSQRKDVLVATPGRLLDHLASASGLKESLQELRMLVLDEADQLLEMGFLPDVERILKQLPKNRQTMLFSATVPQKVHGVAGLAFKGDYVYVDTVGDEDVHTNEHVPQHGLIVPFADQIQHLLHVLQQHKAKPGHKVIVFLPTARMTQFLAEVMNKAGLGVMEIHSRKSQSYRTKVASTFRAAKEGILLSSDVSARGMDYPDVTAVVQVGLPSSREQYIHRLGRTGRAGKEGEGLLVLDPAESGFLAKLNDLPIQKLEHQAVPSEVNAQVEKALAGVPFQLKSQAYQAWLGFYNSNLKQMRWDKPTLVQEANKWCTHAGLSSPPPLQKSTISKMGLKGVPGLVVGPPTGSHQGGRRR